jgi:hypothetical protein
VTRVSLSFRVLFIFTLIHDTILQPCPHLVLGVKKVKVTPGSEIKNISSILSGITKNVPQPVRPTTAATIKYAKLKTGGQILFALDTEQRLSLQSMKNNTRETLVEVR